MKKIIVSSVLCMSVMGSSLVFGDTAAEIDALEDRVSQLETLVMAMQEVHDYMDVIPDPNVQGGHIVRFNGVNVQVNNGISPQAVNGLGNLIVGYNELRTVNVSADWSCSIGSYDTENDCLSVGGVWAVNHKSGSHNLIVGSGHNYSSRNGLVAGFANSILGFSSAVIGGQENTASGGFSSVSGGRRNTSSGLGSAVGGGMDNEASGSDSSVSGGRYNKATNYYSSVTAGSYNQASGNYSSITAGRNNVASGEFSSVTGGYSNTASGNRSNVSGGHHNEASGGASSVSGGWLNESSAGNTSVLGGKSEIATNQDQRIPQ